MLLRTQTALSELIYRLSLIVLFPVLLHPVRKCLQTFNCIVMGQKQFSLGLYYPFEVSA